MRTTQLRQADLNLLVVFVVLAEERNVSRAASRLLLSQPAVTRALQRLRAMFHDDLLVRISGNYELTPKGQSVLHELEILFPRVDRLLAGAAFDPAVEEAHFRMVGTDYAAQVIGEPISKRLLAAGKGLRLDLSSLGDDAIDTLERGRVDLLLHADDGYIPNRFCQEVLFEEEFVCVVSEGYPCGRALSLKQYLMAQHLGITIFEGMQTVPEERLRMVGGKRQCMVNVWSFSAAMRMVRGTDLVATVPKRLTKQDGLFSGLRVVGAPRQLGQFKYLMAWHPRMESDAAHIWLRSLIRQVGKELRPKVRR